MTFGGSMIVQKMHHDVCGSLAAACESGALLEEKAPCDASSQSHLDCSPTDYRIARETIRIVHNSPIIHKKDPKKLWFYEVLFLCLVLQ